MNPSKYSRIRPNGLRKVRRLAVFLGVLAAVVFLLPAPASHAETYDLHIRSFCSPASNCGASSEQAYYANLIDMTHELNVQWRQHGISFRPIIFPIDISNPNEYAITGCGVDDLANPFSCSNDIFDFCVDDSGCSNGGTCEPTKFCEDLQTRCSTSLDCVGISNGTSCLARNKQQRKQLRKNHADPNREVVTILLVQEANWCCSNPPSAGDSDESISAIVCDGRRDIKTSGSVWSHEMGHYFCLRHTFTGAEFADNNEVPNHDGDPPHGVFDTPGDPKRVEGHDRDRRCSVSTGIQCSGDGDCPGGQTCLTNVFVEGHEFCMANSTNNTDAGSHYDSSCTTTCQRCVGGRCGAGGSGSLVNIPFDPDEHNAMSYYGSDCVAPFSLSGQLYRPFSNDQNTEINTCLSAWQRRSELVDVCADRGGDFDRDGICQIDDNCPLVANTAQRDQDGDGDGDECDLCPADPTPTGDIDGDGIGDICDPDRDDDGCLNAADQNPDESMIVVGRGLVVGPCENGGFQVLGFEGDDSDNDGFLNCEDVDDDNDGICDEDESSLSLSAPPGGCEAGPDTCPINASGLCFEFEVGPECVDPWIECLGSGCVEYFAFWEQLINPSPESSIRFDNIQLYNQSMYASAPVGMTAASAAVELSGQALLGRGPVQEYRLSLWREGGTEPEAILIESYTPSEAVLQSIDQGDVLVFEKKYNEESGSYQYLIRTEYGMGGTPRYDTDDDNIPTTEDNCRDLYNPDQRDSDGDGFGDRCDGDINNDGFINSDDLDLIISCMGVDVSTGIAFGEPADYDGEDGMDFGLEVEPTSSEQAAALMRCRNFDLTGDGMVDFNDRNLIESNIGGVPGPSGAINRAPFADAGPDREISCGSSFDVDAGGSMDPDGDPISCRWESESCSIEDPDSCDAVVTCPPGGLHTLTLSVNDGTTSTTDSFLANAGSCSPGQIGNSLRVEKIDSVPGFQRVELSFANECEGGNTGIVRYGVYEGNLMNQLTTATRLTCSASPGSIVIPQADAAFFLVAPNSGPYEGGFGLASDGSDRDWIPQAERCREIQALPVCPTP